MADLSQDEIDALIAGADDKDETSGTDDGGDNLPPIPTNDEGLQEEEPKLDGNKNVSVYNFRKPQPIPEDQKKTITLLHEGYAQRLKLNLSSFLRSDIDISLQNVEQLSFAQYTNSLSTPTCITSFDMAPLTGYGIIEVNAVIAYAIIDKMLGGDGTVPAQVRRFTDVELAIVRRLIDTLLTELTVAWKPILNIAFTPKEMRTNPSMVRIIPTKEICLIITFNVKILDTSGLITICLPYANMEPISFKLGSRQWRNYTAKQSEDVVTAHKRNFYRVKLQLSAILGRVRLPMEEVLALQPGDILDLGTKTRDPIILRVSNEDKFEVNPGLLGKYKAITIQKELIKE